MKIKYILSAIGLLFSKIAFASIPIVAAENIYGNLAKTVGGPYVEVTNVLNNPNQDPHLFSANPNTAKAVAKADIIIYNGIGYDPWMPRLLSSRGGQPPIVIVVADVMGKKMGDNPHLWYAPGTYLKVAEKLTGILTEIDPTHRDYYRQQLTQIQRQNEALNQQIANFKNRFAGTPVIATESVFGYMTAALGLSMQGYAFQLSIMNDIPPSAQQTADFERKLKTRAVKALIYNNQVIDPVTERMKNLAAQMGIPVVGISETQPANLTYWQWVDIALITLEKALLKT